jgi:hypothetical protein
MSPAMSILRAAAGRMRGLWLVWLGVGTLGLMVLGFVWLQIPDSHVWQFASAMVSAASLVVGVLWVWGSALVRVRAGLPVRFVRTVWLVGFGALAWLVTKPIGWLADREGFYAGYWNSQLPAHLRTWATYPRLVAWQDDVYTLLECVLLAALLPLAMEFVAMGAGRESLRVAARAWRRWVFWVVAIGCGWAGIELTGALTSWTPGVDAQPVMGHSMGLASETLSMVARVGGAYVVDVLLVGLVLAVTAVCLAGERTRTNTD